MQSLELIGLQLNLTNQHTVNGSDDSDVITNATTTLWSSLWSSTQTPKGFPIVLVLVILAIVVIVLTAFVLILILLIRRKVINNIEDEKV